MTNNDEYFVNSIKYSLGSSYNVVLRDKEVVENVSIDSKFVSGTGAIRVILVVMLNIQFGEYLWGSGADSVEYRLVVLPRIYWLMIPFITGLYLWGSRNTK